jgi:hypothetical protein
VVSQRRLAVSRVIVAIVDAVAMVLLSTYYC